MAVIINGKEFNLTPGSKWFYADIVLAAMELQGASFEERRNLQRRVLFTVTYCDADEIPSEGTLTPYSSTKQVKVKEGTIFNVIDTSNA